MKKNNDNHCFLGLCMNIQTHIVIYDNNTIKLSDTEFKLLKLFLLFPELPLNTNFIAKNVWGITFPGESNIIAVYIGYIRRKLEKINPVRIIQTIRGVGYVMRNDDD